MRKTQQLLAISLALLLMGFACKKDNTPSDELPPATQTGRGTFGCYINGKLYVAYGHTWGSPNPGAVYLNDEYNDHLVSASGSILDDTTRKHVGFKIQRGYKTGKYYFKTSTIEASYTDQIASCYFSQLTPIELNYGWIEITRFDTVERVMSGLFEFDLVLDSLTRDSAICDTILHITQGRFDCKLF